ncbi:MAG: hypothetical protein R2780_04020 [Crocinitomicaceae bacterium]
MKLQKLNIFIHMQPPEEGFHELDCYYTWLGEDGIARTLVRDGAVIGIEDAMLNSRAVNSLRENAVYPLIVDTTKIKSITKEARDYLSIKDRETNVNAIAIVRKSIIGNMVANFFIGLNKPSVPTKLFNSEEEAVEWCKNFKS